MRWLIRHRRRVTAVLIYGALLLSGGLAARYFTSAAEAELLSDNRMMVLTIMAAFILLSALPFVPGVEIGIGLLMVFGERIAAYVYLCMVVALMLAYLIGRFVPPRLCAGIFGYLGFGRARSLVESLARMPRQERLSHLTRNAPNRVVPFLLRNRHIALIAILNLPGNALIGGGGGIAIAAGMSGLYSLPGFLIAVLIAVAPVPLAYLLM